MRSLFVFSALDRSEVLRRLEVARVRTDLPIGVSEPEGQVLVWADLVDDLPAADFDPDDLVEVNRVAGFSPACAVEIAISGHFPDWRQRDLRTLTMWLLSEGGCATSTEVDEFKTADEWRAYWVSIGEPLG